MKKYNSMVFKIYDVIQELAPGTSICERTSYRVYIKKFTYFNAGS